MKICAWKNQICFQALFFAVLFTAILTTSWAEDTKNVRVAAVIYKGADSMALVEDSGGEQKWYRVGDDLAGARVVEIDGDGITLLAADGETQLTLSAGAAKQEAAPAAQAPEQSKNFQYLGLLSQINAVDRAPGESREQAVSRNMNHVLGLANRAKITAIDRVEVSSPSEARAEIASRLLSTDPIRISIEGDHTKVLYVMPDPDR